MAEIQQESSERGWPSENNRLSEKTERTRGLLPGFLRLTVPAGSPVGLRPRLTAAAPARGQAPGGSVCYGLTTRKNLAESDAVVA